MGKLFDDQLEHLNNELIEFGSLIEKSIENTVKALIEENANLAKDVVSESVEIANKEKSVEDFCLKLLLNYQPVAKDLRYISSALKMITDMERIGHQCADICKIILELYKVEGEIDITYIPLMAERTMKMVNKCVDAFVKQDLELAQSVIEYDDKVDDLFKQVKTKLIEHIKNDSGNNELTIDLLMIAKYLERIGDHTVNIAEWIVFSITGKHTDMQED